MNFLSDKKITQIHTHQRYLENREVHLPVLLSHPCFVAVGFGVKSTGNALKLPFEKMLPYPLTPSLIPSLGEPKNSQRCTYDSRNGELAMGKFSLNNDFRCITSALYTSLHHIPYTLSQTKHGSPRFFFISGFLFSFPGWGFLRFFCTFRSPLTLQGQRTS